MASGVETEKGLAAALFEAPVHAVLVTRELKRAPGDLFLRTGSGRAKKRTLPHHVIYAAIAMVTGTPKDAVANALAFGALSASKLEASARDMMQPYGDGTGSSERVVKQDLYAPGVPRSLIDNILPQFPQGQSLLDAIIAHLEGFAELSKVQDLNLGLRPEDPYKSDVKIRLTTRPVRGATIIHRVDDNITVECTFTSPQMAESPDGPIEPRSGRSSYEVIEWSALVEMARLTYAEQDQKSPPHSELNPSPAKGGTTNTETSATPKTEAAEAPPSTASDSFNPPASRQLNQQQTSQQSEHPTYSLSLSPGEGVGMLGVSAGLQEVNLLLNIGNHPNEHSYPYPASASLA